MEVKITPSWQVRRINKAWSELNRITNLSNWHLLDWWVMAMDPRTRLRSRTLWECQAQSRRTMMILWMKLGSITVSFWTSLWRCLWIRNLTSTHRLANGSRDFLHHCTNTRKYSLLRCHILTAIQRSGHNTPEKTCWYIRAKDTSPVTQSIVLHVHPKIKTKHKGSNLIAQRGSLALRGEKSFRRGRKPQAASTEVPRSQTPLNRRNKWMSRHPIINKRW